MSDNNFYHVESEVGKLEAVLLHRPGKELERLTPQYLEELLFDDIPWLGRIREEHDLFAEALRSRGTNIYYYDRLLADILVSEDVRDSLIKEVCAFSGLDLLKERDAIKAHLASRTPANWPVSLSPACIRTRLTTGRTSVPFPIILPMTIPFI